MNNKELLEAKEKECYEDLLAITNVRHFNMKIGESELKAIHNNKASFKFMLAYTLNTIINSECPNSSYITFGDHFSLSYLMNFHRMSPFNSDDLSEHIFNDSLLDGDKFPYYSNNNVSSIKRIDPETIYSNDIMLKIDIKYFCDNKDFVLDLLKQKADVYNLVDDDKVVTNTYFIVVPKGYKVDDPNKFTLDYAYNHKKEGEILFRIYPYNFSYSFLHSLKKKYGELDLSECLNHYKYSYKYGHLSNDMLCPTSRQNLKETGDSLKDLFNECLIDYTLRDCHEYSTIKVYPLNYFIFFDDIYHKFIDMGDSPKVSYDKCLNIFKYLWSNKEDNDTPELKQLRSVIDESQYKDLQYKLKYRFYDDVVIEFYYYVQIAYYEYKYRDDYFKFLDEYRKTRSNRYKEIES